ncbi:U3 small nucleolar RNA-associated protein 4 homolog [Microplitis demolitor]|uniref:U3 small nucleolar RNA-associated protein 4 homolog n=1 Tax=Microplitis demolitor TaxID=69319 RepID=UPI0004CC94A4|nr:U3 small nucleolar RNA-associated protein 4 homolog [Microplitis demolitor]
MASYKIHNVRFYNLEPRSIFCLCYDKYSKKLALSRNDNSIELWNVANAPFLESTIVDHIEESIESMIWINSSRLLSTGLRGMITEYNVSALCKKYEVAVTGGAAWCIDINPSKTRVAVGTEDGYVNTFTIAEDSLIYERIFDKQKGRILCIKWDNTGDIIFSGSADTVRVWNAISGHAIHKMTTARKHIKKETIVWCLGVTSDNYVVSGDSRGVLSIWDPNMGTLVESHDSHTADILALTISQDSNVIYCAGVDPVVRSFSKVTKTAGGKGTASWVKGIERRLHMHDVRALVEADGKLYSAGVDGYLAQSSYPPKMLAKYPPLLQPTCVTVCRKRRRILLRYVDYLELWELGNAAEDATVTAGMFHSLQSEPRKLLELRTKGQETITSCAISKDSKIIVYSTETHMRVFNFSIDDDDAHLQKSTASKLLKRVHKMLFSPNGKLFIANAYDTDGNGDNDDGNKIYVYKKDNNQLMLESSFSTSEQKIENIGLICFSPDNKYLICSDRCGGIVVYIVAELASGSPSWWSLPRYTCPPTAMAVQKSTSNLVVVYSDHKIIEYNLPRRLYTEFSNNLQSKIPTHWLARPFPITNITFDPNNDGVIILHDDTTVYALHKNKDLSMMEKGSKIRKHGAGEDDSRSSSGSSSQTQSVFQSIKKYKHLVHFEWFNNEEMVAVEVNPISLTEKLPPTLKQKCYGVM